MGAAAAWPQSRRYVVDRVAGPAGPRGGDPGVERHLQQHIAEFLAEDLLVAALAQMRQAAIRNHLCGDTTLPDAPVGSSNDDGRHGEDDISGPDLGIPLGDAPVPARGGRPCPSRIGTIKLTIAETARIERLARQHAAGLITRARLAFCLRWSRWRRRHQACVR